MRPRIARAQIHLPPLTTEQAWLLVKVLECAASAIWRAHGDAMADVQKGRSRRSAQEIE